MRWKGLLGLVAAATLLAGCGDEDGESSGSETDRTAEAQQVVDDTIAAYIDKDFEAMCELQDARVTESITTIGKIDSCPEAYEKVFKNQADFALEGGQPFDDFIAALADYEAGEVEALDDGPPDFEVHLEGPQEASSYLVDEDGELKVSELFVTPDADTPSDPTPLSD